MKIGMIAPVYTRIDIATHRASFIDPFLIGNIEADRLRPKRRLDTARNHPHKTSALLAQKANTDRNSVGSERKYSWIFFFSSRRRHTRSLRDWSSDVCSSDLQPIGLLGVDVQADIDRARQHRQRLQPRIELGLHALDLAAGVAWMQRRQLYRDARSEERRVGKECRSRRSLCQLRKTS